jgi:hypothetical protein
MPSSALRSINLDPFTRLWWLPPGGLGNDLDDRAWAPALELSQPDVPAVLAALRAASVPAYAAPARLSATALSVPSAERPDWQLWVGTSAYGTAEAALLTVMPAVNRRRNAA